MVQEMLQSWSVLLFPLIALPAWPPFLASFLLYRLFHPWTVLSTSTSPPMLTGTSLGDPIEVGAILEVHDIQSQHGYTTPVPRTTHGNDGKMNSGSHSHSHRGSLHLLAAKSMVGHAEPASGLTGLMYAMMQVRACVCLFFVFACAWLKVMLMKRV